MHTKLTSKELSKINGGVVAGATTPGNASNPMMSSSLNSSNGIMNNTSGVLNNTSSLTPSFDNTSSLGTAHSSFSSPMGDQSLTPSTSINGSLSNSMTTPGSINAATGTPADIGHMQSPSLSTAPATQISPNGMATVNNPGPGGNLGGGMGGANAGTK